MFPRVGRRPFGWAVSWLKASDWVWGGTANPYRSYLLPAVPAADTLLNLDVAGPNNHRVCRPPNAYGLPRVVAALSGGPVATALA